MAASADAARPSVPAQILAGSIHYFRVHPELWSDRLARLRAMGLNAIQTCARRLQASRRDRTACRVRCPPGRARPRPAPPIPPAAYKSRARGSDVPWNFHEPFPGRVDLASPSRHLFRFLRLAQAHGLLVVLRPGPYVCAELEFGGLPAWLLADGPVALRTYAQPYLGHVDRWWGVLLPALRAEGLLLDDGGPVMMLQIENEYGERFCSSARLSSAGQPVTLHTSSSPFLSRTPTGQSL